MTGIKLEEQQRRLRHLLTATRAFIEMFNPLELTGAKEQQWWSVFDQLGFAERDLVSEHVEPAPEAGAVAWLCESDDPETHMYQITTDRGVAEDKAKRLKPWRVTPLYAAPPPPPVSPEAVGKLVEALRASKRLIDEALPKFDWSKSALDANAIRLLNEVPGDVARALALVGEGG